MEVRPDPDGAGADTSERATLLAARAVDPDVRTALALSGLDAIQVWCNYVAISGRSTYLRFTDYLAGVGTLPSREVVLLKHTLNEHFWSQGFGDVVEI